MNHEDVIKQFRSAKTVSELRSIAEAPDILHYVKSLELTDHTLYTIIRNTYAHYRKYII